MQMHNKKFDLNTTIIDYKFSFSDSPAGEKN
jgi:hypothetical protein